MIFRDIASIFTALGSEASVIEAAASASDLKRSNGDYDRVTGDQRRRSKMRAEGVTAKAWKTLSVAVFKRDGRVCAYCGDTSGPFHVDHIRPVALDGPTVIENLTVACSWCNVSKGGKTLEDWREFQCSK